MPLYTLYPDGNDGWSGDIVASSGTVAAALGAGGDYTNWKKSSYYTASFPNSITLAANQRVYGLSATMSLQSLPSASPSYSIYVDLAYVPGGGGGLQLGAWSGVFQPGATRTGIWARGNAGAEIGQTALNAATIKLQSYGQPASASSTLNVFRVFSLAMLVDVRTQPTCTVTGPTGTVTNTTPTITWSYGDPDYGLSDGAQSHFHVKVYDSTVYGGGGFNPASTPGATYNSTATASGAFSRQVDTILSPGTYRAYVKAAKNTTWDGSPWWSEWSYVQFTIPEEGGVPDPDPDPDPGGGGGEEPPENPNPPTTSITYPTGGVVTQDERTPTFFYWTFSDSEDGTVQNGAEVRYRVVGAEFWNLTSITGDIKTTSASLPAGDYEWQVRVRDSGSLWSDWTASALWTIDPAPPPPPDPVLEGPDASDFPLRQLLYDGRPEYICLAYDLADQVHTAELPLDEMSFSYVLNGAGTLAASLPIGVPQADPTILIPGRTAIHIYRNRTPVWAGILWGISASIVGSAQRIELDASEYWSAFLRGSDTGRFVRHANLGLGSISLDQVDIARELVTYAQDETLHGPMLDLGIGTINQASGVARADVTFDGTDLKPIGEAILEMAEAANGFDFRIDLEGELGAPLVKTFRCIYPRQSAYVPHLALDNVRGVVKLDYQEDALRTARRFIIRGQGDIENTEKLLTTEYVHRDFLRTYGDVTSTTALGQIAEAAAARYGRPPRLPKVSIRNGSGGIQWIGSLHPGDFVNVDLDFGWVHFTDPLRVVQFEVAHKAGLEVIALTLNEDVEV